MQDFSSKAAQCSNYDVIRDYVKYDTKNVENVLQMSNISTQENSIFYKEGMHPNYIVY